MTLFKHAFRQLALRPGFSVCVAAMLAIGIGAATAIFVLFYQVLVRPLPVPEPERLVNLTPVTEPESRRESFSYPMFRDLEAEQTVFTRIAAYSPFTANVANGERALSAQGDFVSGGYFDMLGLQAAVGRLIGRQDEPRVGESAVVVLSHDFWQSRFGGDPDLIGRRLIINGQPLTVIGVAPAEFVGAQFGVPTQVFVPITMRWRLMPVSDFDTPDNRNFSWVRVFARLPGGVSLEQAAAEFNVFYGRMLREIEAPLRSLSGEALQRFLAGRVRLSSGARGHGGIRSAAQSLTLLLGVTLLVLLIVCVNVANLLLVRGAARGGEMAIRASLGASRGRLLTELLVETAVPVVVGSALALPVAALTLAVVTPILPGPLAAGLGVGVGWTAVAFAVLATVSSALMFGVLPAVCTARTSPMLAMKGRAAQTLGWSGGRRVRGALATAQIAFSTVLLVLAGLFAASLHNIARIDLGMNVDSLVSFSVSPRLSGYDGERTLALYEEIERALAAEPGVSGVASAALRVMSGADFRAEVGVKGFDEADRRASGSFNIVGPSFFGTLGIPVLAGREFVASDTVGSPHVAIVNSRFAREYGLEGNAVGKYLGFGFGPGPADGLEIVGVVADAAYSRVKDEVPPQFFLPRGPLPDGSPFSFLAASSSFYVRTALDPDALLKAVPRIVAAVDPTLPVDRLLTMRRQTRDNIFVDRLVSILSASFAAIATLLAAVGIYGVMAYNVTTRTRELGLRLALGAEPSDLRAMVLVQAAWMALFGLAIGILAALGLARVAEALLFGLTGHDPLVLVAAAAVLAVVVLAAVYWPARRASGIAPMEALRYE